MHVSRRRLRGFLWQLERFVAKRMGATTFETDSSHVPMLSQPDFVLDVIPKSCDRGSTEKGQRSEDGEPFYFRRTVARRSVLR